MIKLVLAQTVSSKTTEPAPDVLPNAQLVQLPQFVTLVPIAKEI